jgi:hypothetical protein
MSFPYSSRILFSAYQIQVPPYTKNDPLNDAAQADVIAAFDLMYNNSPEAKKLLDGFFADPSRFFTINNALGEGNTSDPGINKGVIYFDYAGIGKIGYITPTGKAVKGEHVTFFKRKTH